MARSRFSPRNRQKQRWQARSWRKYPPRPAAYASQVADGEHEYQDVVTDRGRLDYHAYDFTHVWDMRTRHHRRSRIGAARRRRERVRRAVRELVTTARKKLAIIGKDRGKLFVTVTITRCNSCGQSCIGEAADLVHLPGCPCSGESDD